MLIVVTSDEVPVCDKHDHFHIAEVRHLFITVLITLIVYSIVGIAELVVHIVAGKEDKLPALIVIVVLYTPHADFTCLNIVPIKAEQVLLARA